VTDLRLFLQHAPAEEFRGSVHRLCISLYRNRTLSMSGARDCGARYNIRNYFGALYTALDLATARAEMRRYFTVEPDCGLVEAVIDLELTRVVDLTKHSALRRLGVRSVDLTGERYAVCQEFGLRAWECGLEGLLVPSAAARGRKNLVVFLDNQQPAWSVRLRSVAAADLLITGHALPGLRRSGSN